MIAQDVVADVLLTVAVLLVLASSVGVAVMHETYQRLHLAAPAVVVAPVLVALAVAVEEGYSENTTESFLALVFIVIAGPLLSHAIVRATRVRERGDWRPGEGVPSTEEQEE